MFAVATTLITFILPPTFASTARILPTVTDPAAIGTEMEIIRSKAVLLTVATNLQLARKYAEKYKEGAALSMDLTYLLLSRQTTIRRTKNANLIEINVLSDDPAEAADIANEIARVYVGYPLAARGAGAKLGPQIIDQADPNHRPAYPNKTFNIGSGLAVGAVFGLLGIWLILKSGRPRRALGNAGRMATR
jgi:uncharacterized protein involved in exopolysaccharide biosynthesis